jgi:pimeloyl-ACP methyl ester carboxylesterase
MTVFLLVHGGFSGGWIWKKVSPLLRAAGHEVHHPSLSGMGDRATEISPDIDLHTHVDDVCTLVQNTIRAPVTLVASSYGGFVASGVLHRIPEAIDQVIFNDALIPEPGLTLQDLLGPIAPMMLERAMSRGDGWRVPAPAPPPGWTDFPLCDQPLATMETALALDNPKAAEVPCTYIRCTGEKPEVHPDGVAVIESHAMRAASRGWPMIDLDATHNSEWSKPAELSELLLGLLNPEREVRDEESSSTD